MNPDAYAFIDVRSEGEFLEGSIPRFLSCPILTNSERHEVGLNYRLKGQESAIKLGNHLVEPHRAERVVSWKKVVERSSQKEAIVTCWRGGLRSKIACEWLQAEGVRTHQVEGGYKAIRAQLLQKLENPPGILILSGLTGSGKTDFLHRFHQNRILDIEWHACHRGSAFGAEFQKSQPTQALFENRMALALQQSCAEILVEDESICVGAVHIPKSFYEKMLTAPLVILESPRRSRAEAIVKGYIKAPEQAGIDIKTIQDRMENSLTSIRKRLGGSECDRILKILRQAFQNNSNELHGNWVEELLRVYYDRFYEFGLMKKNRNLVFKGNEGECFEWLNKRFV